MTPPAAGVSVIVPTHRGKQRLSRLLESLETQTLNASQWEVIFVPNGQDDGSRELLEDWISATNVEARVISLTRSGASRARNAGLANARRETITFVDDDDWLQPRFLEVGVQHSALDQIVLLPIKDEEAGQHRADNSIEARRALLAGSTATLSANPWVLGFNACKFVPAHVLRRHRYNQLLRSGEDVAFFGELLRYDYLKLAVPAEVDDAAYVRVLRPQSVSRMEETFDFSVRQRLEVIAALQRIPVSAHAAKARESLERAQFQFVAEYLRRHPHALTDAADLALELGVAGMPWSDLRREKPKTLVVSYCFPPFADSAANVVAKVIARKREPVDVISADMSPVRQTDGSTPALVDPWVHKHTTIDGYPSFTSWPQITQFAQKSVRAVKYDYETLYTRALWSGSHVAGCLLKLKRPGMFWEAEFSDPLRFDATGALRKGVITRGRVTSRLQRALARAGWGELPVESHFVLTEAVTLLLAERLVFSNKNQARVMLSAYPPAFQAEVSDKVVVRPHPTPPSSAYAARPVRLSLDPTKMNIGYFGNFYSNRGLGDYEAAMQRAAPGVAERTVLHIFSSAPAPQIHPAVETVTHPPLDYLEFLNALSQFDVLVVVDVDTSATSYDINPFLPSKYSDYAGSGVPVWAMTEPGSPLDAVEVAYRSRLGSVSEAVEVITSIASDCG